MSLQRNETGGNSPPVPLLILGIRTIGSDRHMPGNIGIAKMQADKKISTVANSVGLHIS
ncbi:MAG: hypothetical protein IPG30_13230 [Chitinophagaceae bacterium]|nr:hypothetical protein [Chitinophagaceae bacterium]